jgi:thiosulfate dehydrogenase [quinone] large subunit
MMPFYRASHLQGGIAAGLPIDHGFVVSSHVVHVLLLFGLGAWGVGRVVGLDARLERTALVRNSPTLRYLLG